MANFDTSTKAMNRQTKILFFSTVLFAVTSLGILFRYCTFLEDVRRMDAETKQERPVYKHLYTSRNYSFINSNRTFTSSTVPKIKTVNNERDTDDKFCVRENATSSAYKKNKCPENPVVTVVLSGGRLGNKMWEYASVWVVAKGSARVPYVPSCLIEKLSDVFENLTAIPPLKSIGHCPITFYDYRGKFITNVNERKDKSIILPYYAQLPELVVPRLTEVLELFKFKQHLREKAVEVLREAAKEVSDPVFVCIHVRRNDYERHLKVIYNIELVGIEFFEKQMNYFRMKYSNVLFLVLSDDTEWCDRNFRGSDILVVKGNSPGQDLAIMAKCNHTILDYGTFGLWGAVMAGGETVLYKLPRGTEDKMADLIPNWKTMT